MATLAAMKARIADELARSDLTSQIALAINDAIAVYQKERFRFSDIDPNAPPVFNTVIGQWVYSNSDNTNIGTNLNIDYVDVQVGTTILRVSPDLPENIKLGNQGTVMRGWPIRWAYEGNKLLFTPVPDAAYQVTLGLFRKVAAPAADDEANNPWMTDAEQLIRSRAKFEIALHVTRDPKVQEAMSPEPAPNGKASGHATFRAWQDLKREANRVTSPKRIRPMAF